MEHILVKSTRISSKLLIIAFVVAAMYFGRNILIPLVFAVFFSTLIYPICKFLEKKLPRIVSILLSLLMVIIILAVIIFFFGTQFYGLFENLKNFGSQIESSFEKLINLINTILVRQGMQLEEIVAIRSESLFASGRELIGNTITISTGFFATLLLMFVYSFLFLLYRDSFKKLFLYHFRKEKKERAAELLSSVHHVAKNYLVGLMIIIVILGVLNGLGLMLIGIEYPFLFGFFAAFLAVIPYIGTFIGGLIPFLYALVNTDNIWTPIFVILWYTFVQALEGNILTPKIVGRQVSLNPLIAIVALLTGGLIWGVSGMILFIPLMAILKVIFDNSPSLQPYGILLGSKFGEDELLLPKISQENEEER